MKVLGCGKWWPDVNIYRTAARQAASKLEPIKLCNKTTGISLFCVVRDEAEMLPIFLNHYRSLGVSRFFIIDNGSSNSVLGHIEDSDDLNVFRTTESYRENDGGNLWINGLIDEFARGEWLLRVDCDELLVYADCKNRKINEFVKFLDTINKKRVFAPLIDIYGTGSDPLFDAAPLRFETSPTGPILTGGPRLRMNETVGRRAPCLTKYPLMYYDTETVIGNPHFPLPYHRNDAVPFGALLHTKLQMAGFKERVSAALTHRQYWNNSEEYEAYALWAGRELKCDISRSMSGPDALLKAGLLLDWQTAFEGLEDEATIEENKKTVLNDSSHDGMTIECLQERITALTLERTKLLHAIDQLSSALKYRGSPSILSWFRR